MLYSRCEIDARGAGGESDAVGKMLAWKRQKKREKTAYESTFVSRLFDELHGGVAGNRAEDIY